MTPRCDSVWYGAMSIIQLGLFPPHPRPIRIISPELPKKHMVDGNQKSRKLTSWGTGSLCPHYLQGFGIFFHPKDGWLFRISEPPKRRPMKKSPVFFFDQSFKARSAYSHVSPWIFLKVTRRGDMAASGNSKRGKDFFPPGAGGSSPKWLSWLEQENGGWNYHQLGYHDFGGKWRGNTMVENALKSAFMKLRERVCPCMVEYIFN